MIIQLYNLAYQWKAWSTLFQTRSIVTENLNPILSNTLLNSARWEMKNGKCNSLYSLLICMLLLSLAMHHYVIASHFFDQISSCVIFFVPKLLLQFGNGALTCVRPFNDNILGNVGVNLIKSLDHLCIWQAHHTWRSNNGSIKPTTCKFF